METRLIVAYSLIAAIGVVALFAAWRILRNRRRFQRRIKGRGDYKN